MKIGMNPQMKLLKLLKNYKYFALKFCPVLLILIIILFSIACEDKIPSRNINQNILEFSEKALSEDKLETKRVDSKFRTGGDSYLFIGKDETVTTRSLMKFTSMNTLPDTIDQVLELKLTLYTHKILPVDTSNHEPGDKIKLWLVKNTDQLKWQEDEWDYNLQNPIDYENLEKDLIATIDMSDDDTNSVQLPESLITFWNDSTNSEGGLILESDEQNGNKYHRIYSSDASSKKPLIYTKYVVEDDTLEKSFYPTDDITFSIGKDVIEKRDYLNVSEMYNDAIFVKFDMSDLMHEPDSNTWVPEARLKLYVNDEKTNNFNDKYYLYFTILDTVDLHENYIYDKNIYHSSIAVGTGDSVVVFNMESPIQSFVSSNTDNYGILIWPDSFSNDVANISFFGDDAEEGKKPVLKVLFAREEK